jgi:hypothetical protein
VVGSLHGSNINKIENLFGNFSWPYPHERGQNGPGFFKDLQYSRDSMLTNPQSGTGHIAGAALSAELQNSLSNGQTQQSRTVLS